MNVYEGSFTNVNWYVTMLNGKVFDHQPSLAVRNHSPDGFAWAYGGSGPAQLALAILLNETDRETAEYLYMHYKIQIISCLPGGEGSSWRLTSEDVKQWINDKGTQDVLRALRGEEVVLRGINVQSNN